MFKKFGYSIAKILPAIALFIGVSSVNSACNSIFYQSKVPTSMEKYRKY